MAVFPDVAVTVREYVPAAVPVTGGLVVEPPDDPPVPDDPDDPLEPVPLDPVEWPPHPAMASTTRSANIAGTCCRVRGARAGDIHRAASPLRNGSRRNASAAKQASSSKPAGSFEVGLGLGTVLLAAVVLTDTAKGAGLPFTTCTVCGTEQVTPCTFGGTMHCNCTAPEKPAAGVTAKAYCAVAPALIVWVFELELLGATVYGVFATPVRDSDCGAFAASSLTITSAVRWPAATGTKVTPMVQLPAIATGEVHPLVTVKSPRFEPESATPVTWRGAVPEFVIVTFCIPDVVPAKIAGENVTLPGVNVTAGVPLIPIPLRATDCEPPGPLSAITRDACRFPMALGINVRLMVQKLFGLSEP